MAGTNMIRSERAAPLTNPITNAGIFLRPFADNPTKAAILYFPPFASTGTTGAAQTFRFNVYAWGTAVTSVTSNFQALLYYGTSTTAASNTAIVTLTNRSYVSTSGKWSIEFDGYWDNRTQVLAGVTLGSSYNLTTLETQALITPVTGVDLTTSGLGFTVGALFGTTGAGNIAYLDGFEMEVL